MRRRNILIVITALLAAAGLGAGLGLSGGAASAATTAKATQWVMDDCSFKPVVKPSTITITCADGGIGLQDLHWTSWTAKLASGYGTMWENDCTPDCAAGHFHHYPALVTAWGSASVKGYPCDRRYTKLTLIFTGKTRPPLYVQRDGKVVATYPLTQTFDAV